MKFTIRALFALTALAALALLVTVSMQTKPPKLPDCIGANLTDEQVQSLLSYYGAETVVESSKSSTYSNARDSIRIEVYSKHVVRVELTVPIDTSLKIKIPRIQSDATVDRPYRTSTTSLDGTSRLIVEPKLELLREIYGNVSYTVTDNTTE